jgi:hypothetical protein
MSFLPLVDGCHCNKIGEKEKNKPKKKRNLSMGR